MMIVFAITKTLDGYFFILYNTAIGCMIHKGGIVISTNDLSITLLDDSFELYNSQIEKFFLNTSMLSKTYNPGELVELISDPDVVAYIHIGNVKIYNTNVNGDEMFFGYAPQYSTIVYSPIAKNLNKYIIAANHVKIYYCIYKKYLAFLATDNSYISHAIYEVYYRNNLNNLPRSQTTNQSSRFKVYYYIYYIAKYFGKVLNNNVDVINIACPPTNHDIAYFNDIHPNNVSKYMSELKKSNIIKMNKNQMILNSISALQEELLRIQK